MSTCLGGAFIGSLFRGWIADGIGRRRAFQLCALPMIIGAAGNIFIEYSFSYHKTELLTLYSARIPLWR